MIYFHGTDAKTAQRIRAEGLLVGAYVAADRDVAARYALRAAAAAETRAAVIELESEHLAHDPRHAEAAPTEAAFRTTLKVPPSAIKRVSIFKRDDFSPEWARQHRVIDQASGVPMHARPR